MTAEGKCVSGWEGEKIFGDRDSTPARVQESERIGTGTVSSPEKAIQRTRRGDEAVLAPCMNAPWISRIDNRPPTDNQHVDSGSAARRPPTGQSQRDCGVQPKVGGPRLPWVTDERRSTTSTRLRPTPRARSERWPQPRCGWRHSLDRDPGSRYAATLGFESRPRWGCLSSAMSPGAPPSSKRRRGSVLSAYCKKSKPQRQAECLHHLIRVYPCSSVVTLNSRARLCA